jgi:hypothetical protein
VVAHTKANHATCLLDGIALQGNDPVTVSRIVHVELRRYRAALFFGFFLVALLHRLLGYLQLEDLALLKIRLVLVGALGHYASKEVIGIRLMLWGV